MTQNVGVITRRAGAVWLLTAALAVAAAAAPPPLEILRINPSGMDVPQVSQIVFQFNRPVVPVGRMARDAAEIPISITPDPGCEWRWLDTSALACQLGDEQELAPATRYQITIRPGIRSEDGATLAEPVVHEFVTQRPRVVHYWFETWSSPGTPVIRVNFNQPVRGASVALSLFYRVEGGDRLPVEVEAKGDAGTVWRLTPSRELPPDSAVRLEVAPGVVSKRGSWPGVEERVVASFRTFPEPRFLGVRCYALDGDELELPAGEGADPSRGCDPLARVSLLFSSPIVIEVLRDHLQVEPDLAGGRTDYDPWANLHSYSRLSHRPHDHVYASPLPEVLRAAAEYRIRGEAALLQDEFGRPLASDLDFRFFTDHRRPRLHLEHEASVMETGIASQLPAIVTNLESVEARFSVLADGALERDHRASVEVPEVADVAFRLPLPVRDWLEGRSGAVVGGASSRPPLPYQPDWFFSQVTPFHVHVKLGHYNSLAWVTDLETGEPVADAEVTIEPRVYETLEPAPDLPTARATTDADGVAVLPGLEQLDPEQERSEPWQSRDEVHLVVRVRKNGQVAVLPAADDFRVETRGPENAWLPVAQQTRFGHLRAWGFTAQGVYRAGDAVDYKVYVRQEGNRRLLPAPAAGYRIKVIDPMEKTVHERDGIELNRFGALDGRFTVPKSGAVGWYRFELEAGFAPDLVRYPLQVLVTDFSPAPFRVTTDLDRELFRPGDQVEVTSRAALHAGGPYVEAATRVTATIEPGPFRPAEERWQGFQFDTGDAVATTVHGSEGVLDDRGELVTAFSLGEPEVLYGRLSVESAVRDDRGKRVAGRASGRFAGRDRYVGVRQGDWVLESGEPARLEVIVAEDTGQIASGVAARARVEHRETRASRVKGAGNAYLTEYVHRWVEVASCDLVSTAEPVACEFVPEAPGLYRLTAAIRDTQERVVESKVVRWAVGPGQVLWEEPPGHHLEVLPEKESLAVGETARYLIKNPFPGARALVTVERYGVIDRWIETLEESSAILEFPVQPDYLPGFYLSVVVMSPRAAPPPDDARVDLGKPGFRMGYVRVPVRDPYKELVVEVEPEAEVYKPRQTAKVGLRVRTRQGEVPETELAVAVLDEAVLDLLARGPALYDPYAGLYDLTYLDLANFNLLQRLLGWQKFEKKGANPGGGGGPDASLRSLFKFVAFWTPSLVPDAQGRAEIEFELPDNLTAWRVLAVAVTPEDRMGLGQATLRVNRPTEIRPALPNQVIEGDRFEARFTVMNRTDEVRTLTVRGGAAGAVEGAPALEETVTAEPFRRYAVGLPVAASEPGRIELRIEAGDAADRDALTLSVPVRRRQALEAAATYGTTDEAKAVESLLFPAGIRTDVGRVSVVTAPTVLGNLEGAFAYLRDYPYVCWEQILSKGVMAAHFVALRDSLDPELSWPEAAELPLTTLERASDFQAPNGGMVFWVPRDEYVSPYLSAYTALALSWLAEMGYSPPPAVTEGLHDYLLRLLRRDDFPDFYSRGMASSVRAVAMAALAREGKATAADLERYRRHQPEMDLFGKAHYLQALERVPGTEAARAETADAILSHASESGGKLVLVETLDDGFARILSSELRTSCAVLSTLVERGEEKLAAAGAERLPFKLVRAITQGRGNRHHWENTQENLFCTRALVAYRQAYERVPPRFDVTVRLDREELGSARFDDRRAAPAEFERPIGERDPGRAASVEIERQGDGRLYYAVRLFFSPSTLEQRRINAGIDVRREVSVERDGAWVLLEDPMTVRRGELVRVDLYLSLPAARHFLVVDDPVPGGLEPVNRQLATASTVDADKAEEAFPPDAYFRRYDDWRSYAWSRWSFYHRELRHDSARFYSDYLPAGRYHLSYTAQVIAPGEFTVPPVKVEEMYDPDLFGQGLPATLRVEGEAPAPSGGDSEAEAEEGR